MLLTVIVLASSIQQLPVSIIDTEMLSNRGFVLLDRARRRETSRGGEIVEATFVRGNDEQAQITVTIERWGQEGGQERHMAQIDTGLPHGAFEDWDNGGWSGHPAGAMCRRSTDPSDGLAQMYIYADQFVVSLQLNHQAVVEGGVTRWLGSDKVGDRLALEGIGRDTLATALGERLSTAQNAIVNGTPIADTMQDPHGNIFVPIGSWCTVVGANLVVNRARGTLSFMLNDRLCVLPVSANMAKRGPEWHNLSGFVVRKNGKYYAPLQGLGYLL